MISWFNRKHTSITLSATEAEYIAVYSSYSEAVCLRKMLEEVADVLTKPLARVKFEYFRDKLGVV